MRVKSLNFLNLAGVAEDRKKLLWLGFSWFMGITIAGLLIVQILSGGFIDALESIFSHLVTQLEQVIFFKVGGIPIIILWLMGGGIFLTLRMGFINIRGFLHAIAVVRGQYDEPGEEGKVTHFQALTTALSGTVGLGSIAGVAIAIRLGGPGAVFWMTLAGFLGMSIKFVECTLGQKFRHIHDDGSIAGGPMYYISMSLSKLGWHRWAQSLGTLYAILCIFGTLGGSNMFQANQSYAAIAGFIPALENYSWLYGLLLAALVGLVIIGGIERIGSVASRIVPVMVSIYLGASLWVLGTHITALPQAVQLIVSRALSPEAGWGGVIGLITLGFRRAMFTSEAGVGSAAITHSAARTEEPVREGLVASLEPFIDTMVICNITSLVIILTGVYAEPTLMEFTGAQLTSAAFASVIGWFPAVIAVAGFLFAFSTMIAWSYSGERAWAYLFGEKSLIGFKFIFVVCVFIGSVVNLGAVLDFSDMTLLLMTVPNLLVCLVMSPQIAADLKDYMTRLKSGQMKPAKNYKKLDSDRQVLT